MKTDSELSMKARIRREYNKYPKKCDHCREKTVVMLKSGIVRCFTCGTETMH